MLARLVQRGLNSCGRDVSMRHVEPSQITREAACFGFMKLSDSLMLAKERVRATNPLVIFQGAAR